MKDMLGDRMKSNYENVTRNYLTRRTPVIIRIDGKAFHTFTKNFEKPFDMMLNSVMQMVTDDLVKNIQGCVLGYTQSDEISLLLVDYENLNSEAWFGYNIQKCASVAASMATMLFNKYLFATWQEIACDEEYDESLDVYLDNVLNAYDNGAVFDARCFNIPKEEVLNYFVWRQNDCYRNAINAIGQEYFSYIDLNHKTVENIKEMLEERNISLANFATTCLYGYKVYKNVFDDRKKWLSDDDIKNDPQLFKNNRDYFSKLFIFN